MDAYRCIIMIIEVCRWKVAVIGIPIWSPRLSEVPQQTWAVRLTLVYCWPTVYGVGPTVNQRWANVSWGPNPFTCPCFAHGCSGSKLLSSGRQTTSLGDLTWPGYKQHYVDISTMPCRCHKTDQLEFASHNAGCRHNAMNKTRTHARTKEQVVK